MDVLVIYISFLALIFVLFIISTYFISSLISRWAHQRRLGGKMAEIEPLFNEQMAYPTPSDVPTEKIARIKALSHSRLGLEAFTLCYAQYVADYGYSDKVRDYAGRVIDYDILQRNRIVRNQYRTSYILYLLAEYRIHNPRVDAFAIHSLNDKSLYARHHALRVIKNTEDTGLIMAALDTVNGSSYYFNNRMLVDFLDTFTGNQEALSAGLVEKFHAYNPNMQRLVLDHFTNARNRSEAVRQLMLRCLNGADKELAIGATKYFGWVTEPRATDAILRNLTHNDWELRAQSARVSQWGYDSPWMRTALERRLCDENWHVRLNSAFAYTAMMNGQVPMQHILEAPDSYARDVSVYAMFAKNHLDYMQYLQMIREQPIQLPKPDAEAVLEAAMALA